MNQFKLSRAVPKAASTIWYSWKSIRITFECHQKVTEQKVAGTEIFDCKAGCEHFPKTKAERGHISASGKTNKGFHRIFMYFYAYVKRWVGLNPCNRLGRHLVWKLKLAIRTGRVGPGPTTFQNVPTSMTIRYSLSLNTKYDSVIKQIRPLPAMNCILWVLVFFFLLLSKQAMINKTVWWHFKLLDFTAPEVDLKSVALKIGYGAYVLKRLLIHLL